MNMTVNLTDTSLTTRLADPVFREYINKACEVVQRSGIVRRNVLSAQTSKINNKLKAYITLVSQTHMHQVAIRKIAFSIL